MNKVILMGRLAQDPELRSTSETKIAVARFTVAVSRPKVTGQSEQTADFISCVAWRQTAEFITKYFYKGKRICVVGELRTRKYVDRDGYNRTATEVVVSEVHFCGDKDTQPTEEPAQDSPLPRSIATEEFTALIGEDDDLPF